MKEIKFCLFCGSELEHIPFDAGQAAILEPWCEECRVGFHKGTIKESLLYDHDRWDCLVGNIDMNGNLLRPREEWMKSR